MAEWISGAIRPRIIKKHNYSQNYDETESLCYNHSKKGVVLFMKYERKNQIKVIHEQTAEAFEEKVNRVLMQYSNPEVIMDRNIPFCAYISYTVERYYDADTVAECFEIYGAGRKCADCGHFKPTEDRRRKWQPCEFAAYGKTCADAGACDLYYIEKMEQWENDRTKVLLDRGRGRTEFSRRRDSQAAL